MFDCWISGYSLYATPNMLESSEASIRNPEQVTQLLGPTLHSQVSLTSVL